MIKLGIDAPSASLFRHAADSRVLFRPFGRRGGTYVVSAERAAHLRAWQRWYMMLGFVVILVAVRTWQLTALWLVPVLVAPLYVKYWHFARTLPRTDEEYERAKGLVVEAICGGLESGQNGAA